MTSSHPRHALRVVSALLVVGAFACSDKEPPEQPRDRPVDPGIGITPALPAAQQAELEALTAELAAASDLSADELAARVQVPFSALGYDPSVAAGLSAIQASTVKLDADELARLGRDGFVVTERKRYPSFVYGYQTIYSADLPVYVSADAILYALHRSYDEMLKSMELGFMRADLSAMLGGMRAALAAGAAAGVTEQGRKDADVYLAVAASLLDEVARAPVAGGDPAVVQALVAGATAASGTQELELFGVLRTIDFSQFTPRGHYTEHPLLKSYFRAMMWLGRIDFPIIDVEETPTGFEQVFRRRQLEGALTLRALLDTAALARWTRIDSVLHGFVGEPDSMSPPQIDALMSDLGVADAAGLLALSDQTIAQGIVDGGYGTQKIASQVLIYGPHADTAPLASTFLLMGQRYVIDSHVFSNLVYDRVNRAGSPARMMPNPLDVAYAALGNNQAAMLLAPEISRYGYAPDLYGTRFLVDAQPAEFWSANLYNLWLGALRALSPALPAAGLPAVAGTEAWGRRILNTQLASWAELRHDTILYAKQSYTTGVSCEFPDAYVEPYPAFFARVRDLAVRGTSLVDGLGLPDDQALPMKTYFGLVNDVATILGEMADHQRTGTPHTQAHMDFINRAVALEGRICGEPPMPTGWYADLFFNPREAAEFDPTIADVHTQPTDEGGAPVGRVLHVGTGMPRLMVVTVNTCTGPHAYAGVASAYFEKITEQYKRLTDEEWKTELGQGTPADVPWMQDLVVR